MQIHKIQAIIQGTNNGTSIKSFNMLSGEKITSPDFIFKEITKDGLIIFQKKGCGAEGRGDVEIATEPEMIESITYFPSK